MKSQLLLSLALLGSAVCYPQAGLMPEFSHDNGHHGRNKSIEKIQRLDSVIGYVSDQQSGSDICDYVFIYMYARGEDEAGNVIKLDLPDRINVNMQVYSYNGEGFKTRYLYQEWTGSNWMDKMLVEYFPDGEGRLYRELFSGPGTEGGWAPYQQHIYSYDYLGRIELYLRKMYNSQNGWYDFSQNIWTFNDADKLTGRLEKRVADDYIIWTEAYNYGDGVKPTERIRQTMRFDPVLKRNILTNDTRQLYYYDEFNDPSVTEQYRWVGGEWVYAGKSLYFYSFIPGRKVTICHNGHTISVAPQAVKAHLAHGDSLGPCEGQADKEECRSDKKGNNGARLARVYPNPASGYFNLILPEGHGYDVALLFSGDGRIVRSAEVDEALTVSFDAGGLKSGRYILKIQGSTGSEEIVVILK